MRATAHRGSIAASRRRSSVTGTILWKADAEASMATEWASNSSIPAAASPPNPDPTRIYQDTSFHNQGTKSYRFELRNGDTVFATNRCELATGAPADPSYEWMWFQDGDDRWISLQYFVPTGYPTDNTWMTSFQIKPVSSGGGGPNVGLDFGSINRLKFYGNTNVWGDAAGTVYDGDGPYVAGQYDMTRNAWVKFTLHVVFSADPTLGKVTWYGDLADGQGMRTLAATRTRSTMKYITTGPNVTDPAQLRCGIYRDDTIVPTGILWIDGLTVATTRAAAEANAFGP